MEPSFLPEGVGRSLPSKADVVMQVHYHPSGKPEVDRTRIGIYFAKKPVKQILHWSASLNTQMKIPAGAKNYQVEAGYKGTEKFGWVVPMDVTALAVTPHMHKLGRDMTMTVTYPDGRDQDLIRIGDWDFNWQNTYFFEKPIDLPKGSVLKVRAHYDNTTDKEVHWGEATTDEMCIGFIAVVQKGLDLTRPGEKDELGEYFRKMMQDREEKRPAVSRGGGEEEGRAGQRPSNRGIGGFRARGPMAVDDPGNRPGTIDRPSAFLRGDPGSFCPRGHRSSQELVGLDPFSIGSGTRPSRATLSGNRNVVSNA